MGRGSAAALRVTSMLAVVCVAGPAAAQKMGQGEARISARSDVKLSIESGPGTSGERLAALGQAIGSKLAAIKTCYSKVVEERPTVEGSLGLRVELPERGRVKVVVDNDEAEDRQLLRCVTRAVKKGDYGDVERPANGVARLEFTNSAAEGAKRTAEAKERQGKVEVQMEEGRPVTSGGTPDGKVRFRVVGTEQDDTETVAAIHRSVRSGIAFMLDCRRRAGVRDRSPEGKTVLYLQVSHRGRARARPMRTTVEAGKPVGRCLARGLRRTRFEREAAGRARLEIRFAPKAQPDAEP